MSIEITAGKRVLFYLGEWDTTMTPGIVESVRGTVATVRAGGKTYPRDLSELKLSTQDAGPSQGG